MIAAGTRVDVLGAEMVTVSLLGVDCALLASRAVAPRLGEVAGQLPAPRGGPHAGRWELRGDPDGVTNLTLDHAPIFAGALDEVLAHMWCSLTTRVLELTPYFAFHAGVVAGEAGAIAFPGRSGIGKSCLAAACARRGLDLVSDEVLAVDPADDRLVCFPRPVAISPAGCRLVGIDPGPSAGVDAEVRLTAADLGSRWSEGMQLAHVVSLHPGRGPARLEAVARINAVEWLLGNSFNHHRRPAEAFALATRLARRSRAWTLTSGGPREAAEVLAQLLDDE